MHKNFVENNQNIRGKQTISTIVWVLMLAVASIAFICIPTSQAQTTASSIPTHAFLVVSPNPVGVNQEVSILMWLAEFNPTSSGPYGGRWQNYTVLVTKPDGKTQTLGRFIADTASYAYVSYKPDIVGAYTMKFSFPGQHVTGIGGIIPLPIDAFYGASSFTTTFTVQEQSITPSPQPPLPTDYWTRPINAQNQEWYKISGNWLGLGGGDFGSSTYNVDGNFNPYTMAPDSAHIVWTKALEFGGLIGGEFGGTSTSNYYTGRSYESAFGPPVIINGVLYYNSPTTPKMGFYAVDLRTGETLWWQNSTGLPYNNSPFVVGYWGYAGITKGQVYNYKSPNQEGGIPYLWFTPAGGVNSLGEATASQWYMYDAVTGNLILLIANTTGGPTVEGPNGELLVYVLDSTNSWLAMWNSSKCIGTFGDFSPLSTNFWAWRPMVGATLDWNKGVQWNVTTQIYPGQAISKINSGIILATTGSEFLLQDWQTEIAYNATTGAQLWVQNRTLPVQSSTFGLMGAMANGVYTEFHRDSMQWYGYDSITGNQIWGPSVANTNPWGSQPLSATAAYSNFYTTTVDGVHAFNLANGQHLWDFYADNSGLDFPGFNTYPFLSLAVTIADGKVFASTGNSHGDALFRGAKLYAINATSGKQVWSISGFYADTMPVADGYLVAFNSYDNRIYSFGKGQTATTISASPITIASGGATTIQGTVTDQSPGETCLGIPAKGTPAISDDSMSPWMEYLYEQLAKPTNATGVPVTLTALDPNGNTENIGTVTSDITGSYAISWTPPVPGLYTIIATFAGSNSYYSSSSETHLTVSKAVAAQPEQTPTQTATSPPTAASTASPQVTMTPVPPPSSPGIPTTYIVIAVVAIIVVVVAAALALRRRK